MPCKTKSTMKQLRVEVYRTKALGDCTNGGVSSRHNTMTLFWECSREEATDYCSANGIDPDGCLMLVKREMWGEQHDYAAPLAHQPGRWGPMFGGNFIYTSDSRLADATGTMVTVPIKVHDRYETREECMGLSV